MYKYIFLAFQYFTKDIEGLKYFNLYNDQYNNSKADSINYPAILVEFGFSDAEQYPNKIQMFDMTLTLHLATDIYNNFKTGDIQQIKALEHLDLLTDLYKALENKSSDDLPNELQSEFFNIGHIHRKSIEMISNYNAVKVTKNAFIFRFTDASASPVYDKTYADIELHTNIGNVEQEKITLIVNPNK